MTPARWLIAGSWLLLFWLIAGAVWVPMLERKLEIEAVKLLDGFDTGYARAEIQFSGQQAHLTGKVRHQAEQVEILRRISDQVRVPGILSSGLNPVTQVTDGLEIVPYTSGWLMIAAQGQRGMLLGTLATEYEARDVGRLMEERWSKSGGRLSSALKTDATRFDEAPGIQTTLDQLPQPDLQGGGDSAQVQITILGTGWKRLTLDAADDFLRQQLTDYPITETEWQTLIQPALVQTRRYQENERLRIAEAERQNKLPPPHVFLAARDGRLLMRGEVATLKIKRELLNAVIESFPDWRVLDDLRVNSQRRAVAEFGPITTALLPSTQEASSDKSLSLGISGTAWHPVDWQVGDEAQPWRDLLPQDLPPEAIREDSRMVTQWLQGQNQGIPQLPIPAQPSFLTLTLLPDKVILAGQLQEETLRARLVEAAKRAYSGKAIVFSEALLARGTCAATADVEQTVRSFPPLPEGEAAPVIAFARPGQVWKSMPATEEILIPGAVAKSSIIPADFPAAMAEDTFAAEAYDHLRHHWRQSAKPSPTEPTTR